MALRNVLLDPAANNSTAIVPGDALPKLNLTVDIPDSQASISTPVMEVKRELAPQQACIVRIESSAYYNKSGVVSTTLGKLDKALEKSQDSPFFAALYNLFSKTPKYSGFVSPFSAGKLCEFVNQQSPTLLSQLKSGKKAKVDPAYFTVFFRKEAKSQDILSTKFIVTNKADTVVVESEDDFNHAKLFQAYCLAEAKQFGFERVIWCDPEQGKIVGESSLLMDTPGIRQ